MTMTADTTTTELVPGKGTVQPTELVAALTAVIPHAGTDSTLPMLRALKFETTDDKTLTIVATDRYSLGTYRMDWDGGEVDALVSLDDAKELMAYAKKATKGIPMSLTFTADEVEAFDFVRRATFRLMSETTFVKWAAILPPADAEYTDRIDRIGFNPDFMAKFAKAAKRGEPMFFKMPATHLKPMRVEIGDRFVGLIMPVRIKDKENN